MISTESKNYRFSKVGPCAYVSTFKVIILKSICRIGNEAHFEKKIFMRHNNMYDVIFHFKVEYKL